MRRERVPWLEKVKYLFRPGNLSAVPVSFPSRAGLADVMLGIKLEPSLPTTESSWSRRKSMVLFLVMHQLLEHIGRVHSLGAG